MAKSENSKKCFIIMPITTPDHIIDKYKDDADHFSHVLDCLFTPALIIAGFEPVSPKSKGSDVIQADFIKQLSTCELVLCDMSILNPNVFFEFGIRTALNKPVALVIDDKTKNIPFDTSIINFHKYSSSLDAWSIETEINTLSEHVRNAYKKTADYNSLWKYFGVAQTGTYKPEEASIGEKIDLLMNEVSALKTTSRESISPYEMGYLHGYGGSLWPQSVSPLQGYGGFLSPITKDPAAIQEETLQRIRAMEENIALLKANMPNPQSPDSGEKKQ